MSTVGAAVGRADLHRRADAAQPLDQSSAIRPTGTATLPAMQRSPAQPNADACSALTAWSRSASGMMIRWFLAPPAACTRLPCRRAGLVDVPGDGRRADEGDRPAPADASSSASTAVLSPCTMLNTPGRQARLGEQFAQFHRRQRHLFRRLQDERVAAGDRHGEHPQRHHRRKIERRDADADADRMPARLAIDAAAPGSPAICPISRLGMPQANSTISMPRCISARASASVLPCSRVTRAASSSKRCLQQFAEAKHDPGPFDGRRLAPGRAAPRRRRAPPGRSRRRCRKAPAPARARSTD